jgi:hypothetical protein
MFSGPLQKAFAAAADIWSPPPSPLTVSWRREPGKQENCFPYIAFARKHNVTVHTISALIAAL